MDRFLSDAELQALRRWSTPTVAKALETLRQRPSPAGFTDGSIHAVLPELGVMVGYAVTATIRASTPRSQADCHRRALIRELPQYPEPRVVVIHDRDAPHPVGSYWGEVNASVHAGLGCVGVLTDGGVRDVDEVRAIGFQLFAACVLVSHGDVHLVDVGEPVRVGGLSVRPGDLLHGDRHGVVRIPPEIAPRVPELARELHERERRVIEAARRPGVSVPELLRVCEEAGVEAFAG